jgi:aldose 1-epimerase
MNSASLNTLIPTKSIFETVIDRKNNSLYLIQNHKAVVTLTNYGARVVNIIVPNKNGTYTDVVCGPNSIHDFLSADHPYFGATVGRYANRIANGNFSIHNNAYQLEINNGKNHLHGGSKGMQTKVWDVKQINATKVEFTCKILEEEDGYPGNLKVTVSYSLNESELLIQYEALSDKDSIINLTNHTYFNLNGTGQIEDHLLQINAKQYTPINESLIPTGLYTNVANTVFDFTKPKLVGEDINKMDEQLVFAKGYDHNFILDKPMGAYALAAILYGSQTGIEMQVHTTEPGIQLYTGNFMDGKNKVKNNLTDNFRTAICLETQHFPDSPNKPNFPSVMLRAGEKFVSKTAYKFGIK